ncbi:hypothetical protein B0T26DRAFT_738538 [Lasiosphaeria miniovina]|uniref:Protection of telomeres protein 1 n=1 Tax=Lasiosphaeria miniovina TaxID=1954250 RepID=A0AA40E7M3_9PEZI|nr:uncharacterized protein B0T26DRAFT_738538 [Lasiosphaeria miniovina]KAK0728062.1 hypothetical protein B0T26DRAFT_738538 [Lasiosphaeria miniovina]
MDAGRALPAPFNEIRQILDEGSRPEPGSFVDVIGLVTDCRLPMPTTGTDFKSTLTLCDLSTQVDGGYGIVFNIFRPKEAMPQVRARDVVVIFRAKVQKYNGSMSLISNRATCICLYKAPRLALSPLAAKAALVPPSKSDPREPDDEINRYVSYFFNKIDKHGLPDDEEFSQRAAMSLNIKEKFRLLKDVCDGSFYDLIVQVAREPWYMADKMTLYVSDYTENEHFFHYTWDGLKDLPSRAGGGDPYGYTTGTYAKDSDKKDWCGPYGKKAMQITCYEPHASFIRSEVKAGQWLMLRNVQVKFGRDGQNLEGFMRAELNLNEYKINVDVLSATDAEPINPRFKDAIRRWRDYELSKKAQIKEIKSRKVTGVKRKAAAVDAGAGQTNSAGAGASEQKGPRALNGKEKRKMRRAALEQQAKAAEAGQKEDMWQGLNKQVTCESHPGTPLASVESILAPVHYDTTVNGQAVKLELPFICAKYLTRVRVVDFFPQSLEDFSCGRRTVEFDVLSDNGDLGRRRPGGRIWEWRFAVQLEDASPQPPPTTNGKGQKPNGVQAPRARFWAVVNNAEAQCLAGLDATNLRYDVDALARLRERLFTLWGNLEELKSGKATAARRRADGRAAKGRPLLRSDKLPPDSSDVEDGGAERALSNKPFACCIKQYGVLSSGRAGERTAWERVFGLFGTKICT